MLEGLEKVHCEQMRCEIWKLLASVSSAQARHNADIYRKFLQESNPTEETRIQKDIHRTTPGNDDFS